MIDAVNTWMTPLRFFLLSLVGGFVVGAVVSWVTYYSTLRLLKKHNRRMYEIVCGLRKGGAS